MSTMRLVVVMLGSLLVFCGFGLTAGGTAVLIADDIVADDSGFFSAPETDLSTSSYALTSVVVDTGPRNPGSEWIQWVPGTATVRLEVTGRNGVATFVGIGHADDVARFLDGVAHDRVTEVASDPFHVTYERITGNRPPTAPLEEDLWHARASGSGTNSLTWDLTPGRWVAVVMNADATSGVDVAASAGIRSVVVGPAGALLLAGGILSMLVGIVVMVAAIRDPRARAVVPPPASQQVWASDAAGAPPLGVAPPTADEPPVRVLEDARR